MNGERIKGFWLGVIVTVICSGLIITVSASVASKVLSAEFRDIKISVDGTTITPKDANGNVLEPFIVDDSTYLPVRAVADAVGYDVAWDGDTSTVKLDKKQGALKAELDNYSPKRNEITNLTVSGAGFEGLPFKAMVVYKTTQTEYEGKVGEPCPIKVSSATADWKVLIYIVVTDAANNAEHELVVSFTPAS